MAEHPKRLQKSKETKEITTGQEDFGVWLSVGYDTDNSHLKSETPELDWVVRQVGLIMPIDRRKIEFKASVKHSPKELAPWAAEASKSGDLQIEDLSKEEDSRRKALHLPWQPRSGLSGYPWPPTVIFLAIASRNVPAEGCVRLIRRACPASKIALVLGEWWTGHSRTWRLVDNLPTFYWYQLWDRIVPFVLDSRRNSSLPDVDNLLEQAVIISDLAETRRLWQEIFTSSGTVSFACRRPNQTPEGKANLVVIDTNEPLSAEEIRQVRQVYPNAKIAGFFDFPRWSLASEYLQAGCDFVAGKPFHAEGLLQSARRVDRLASSAALPRK